MARSVGVRKCFGLHFISRAMRGIARRSQTLLNRCQYESMAARLLIIKPSENELFRWAISSFSVKYYLYASGISGGVRSRGLIVQAPKNNCDIMQPPASTAVIPSHSWNLPLVQLRIRKPTRISVCLIWVKDTEDESGRTNINVDMRLIDIRG